MTNGRAFARATFERLVLMETDDHVLWPHGMSCGYGVLRLDGRNYYTHRLALTRRFGEDAERTYACHRPLYNCPRSCMNYRHLYWGTFRDNMADIVTDGRSTRGEKHGLCLLTEANVREIRHLRRTTSLTYKQIAERYGVSWFAVKDAAKGYNWGWLDA